VVNLEHESGIKSHKNLERKLFCLERGIDPNKPIKVGFFGIGNVANAGALSIVKSISADMYNRKIELKLFGSGTKGSRDNRKRIITHLEEVAKGNHSFTEGQYKDFRKSNMDITFFTVDANPYTELDRSVLLKNNLHLIDKFTKQFKGYSGKIVMVSGLGEVLAHYGIQKWDLPNPVNQMIAGVPTDYMRLELLIKNALKIKGIYAEELDLTLGGFHSQMWPVIKDAKMITGIVLPKVGQAYKETKDISSVLNELFQGSHDLSHALKDHTNKQARQFHSYNKEKNRIPTQLPTTDPTGDACHKLLESMINEGPIVTGTLQKIGLYSPMFLNFNHNFKYINGEITPVFDQGRWDNLDKVDRDAIINLVFKDNSEREYGEGSFSSLRNILGKSLNGNLMVDMSKKSTMLPTQVITADSLGTFNDLTNNFMALLTNHGTSRESWKIKDYPIIDNLFNTRIKLIQSYDSKNLEKYPSAKKSIALVNESFNQILVQQYDSFNSQVNSLLMAHRKDEPISQSDFSKFLGVKDLLDSLIDKHKNNLSKEVVTAKNLLENNTELLWKDITKIKTSVFVSSVSETEKYTQFQENYFLLKQAIKFAESHRTFLFGTIMPESVDQIYSLYHSSINLTKDSDVNKMPEFPTIFNHINTLFNSLINHEEQILKKVIHQVDRGRKEGNLTSKLKNDFYNAEIIGQSWGPHIVGVNYWNNKRLDSSQVYKNIRR